MDDGKFSDLGRHPKGVRVVGADDLHGQPLMSVTAAQQRRRASLSLADEVETAADARAHVPTGSASQVGTGHVSVSQPVIKVTVGGQ